MKLDKRQLMDIVQTSDNFEILIDLTLPTYPAIQYVARQISSGIELVQSIEKTKIFMGVFDPMEFTIWLDRLVDVTHQAGYEVIIHSQADTNISVIDDPLWSAFIKKHPTLECDLHEMVGELYKEDERAHQLLYDIVLLICKLRINGLQNISVTQVHRTVANMHKRSLGWVTAEVKGPLNSAAILRRPSIQPYLYQNRIFQVCRVYGVLATRLLGGLPLTLCKGNTAYHFEHGCPLN